MQILFLLDTFTADSDTVSNSSNDTIKQNVTDALFTARAFLPGLFDRNVFLILNMVLPSVDFLTDVINAGSGLHTQVIYY